MVFMMVMVAMTIIILLSVIMNQIMLVMCIYVITVQKPTAGKQTSCGDFCNDSFSLGKIFKKM